MTGAAVLRRLTAALLAAVLLLGCLPLQSAAAGSYGSAPTAYRLRFCP